MCLHGLDILSMYARASALAHSHLAKDVEVFVTNCLNNPRSCSAGVDEIRVLQLFVFFVPTMFSGILGFFGRNSTVLSPSGLHANIVEEYVLLSALLHDQSCLQSSPCFQHQFCVAPFFSIPCLQGWVFFSCTWEHESRVFEPSSLAPTIARVADKRRVGGSMLHGRR